MAMPAFGAADTANPRVQNPRVHIIRTVAVMPIRFRDPLLRIE
jgi:hypothetical protein